MKAIKSDSDSDSDEQKRSPGFPGKNRGVTPSVAAPGVTHPSDATVDICKRNYRITDTTPQVDGIQRGQTDTKDEVTNGEQTGVERHGGTEKSEEIMTRLDS